MKDEHATSTIVLRVTTSRKAAYVRAARPGTLSAFMLGAADEKAEGWQPMDTAPKNGTDILGFAWAWDGSPIFTVVWWSDGDASLGIRPAWRLRISGDHAEDDEWTPECWRELPAAPRPKK